MRAVANTLLGHAIVLVVVGGYAALFFIAHAWGLSWIHNSDWRWVAAAFFPILLCALLPLWFILMHDLGANFRSEH